MKSPIALFALPLFAVACVSHAQTIPTTMNFQGRLAKPDGTPVPDTTTQSLTFRLYNALTGGTKLWEQTLTGNVTVKNGIFSVALDFGSGFTPNNTLSDVFGGTISPFLEIVVGGTTLTPRQPLRSTAFAFASSSALTVPDGSLSRSKFATGVLPTSLPPNGDASGDLTGVYPNPLLGTLPSSLPKVSGNLLTVVPSSTGTLDIAQNVANSTAYSTVWQSFTPSRNGYLTKIEVAISGFMVQETFLKIYEGEGLTGRLLSSQTVTVGTTAPTSFILNTPLYLTSDKTYTFYIGGLTDDFYTSYSSTNPYPGGRANAGANADYLFRTYLASPSVVVLSGTKVGVGVTNPSVALHIGDTSGVVVGANPFSGGYTALQLSLSAVSNGYAQIQAVKSSGSFYGNLVLNPYAGNVGINTSTPTYPLDVAGTIHCSAVSTSSDLRYKKNIATLQNPLEALLNLRGVRYEWRTERAKLRNFGDSPQIGFIAQEVEKIFPELVSTDENGYKSVNYLGVVPVLVEAVKTQQQEINELRLQMKAMTEAIAELKAKRK